MTWKEVILFISLTASVCSCSTIGLKNRKGKDFHLEYNSSEKLRGYFKNSKKDGSNFSRSLYNNFNSDTIYRQIHLIVNIKPIDNNKIKIYVLDNETAIDSFLVKGKFRKGYFKVRREINADFIVGPLFWVIGEKIKYIGLTKENDLVIMNSAGSGYLLVILFPFFAAGGVQTEVEYERLK